VKGRSEVYRMKAVLDQTFTRINGVGPGEIELASDFARYLCVLVSGFLEKSLQEMAMQCCRRMAGGPALNYAIAQLEWAQNPSVDNLLTLVGNFSLDWQDELEVFLSPERRSAIGSVVGLRNAVSHGRPGGVTIVTVRDYYRRVVEVVEFLVNRFDPVPPLMQPA
jgi:HEPN superfamily RiboL-PSP-like protein